MNINVVVIPHELQRYPTVGDWWFEEKDLPQGHFTYLEIRVSNMNNEKYETLVATHEIHEAFLCRARGITEKDVTEFDIEFERLRSSNNNGEAGDDPKAPYKKEHFFATSLERLFAAELNVDWKEYDDAVQGL